ncbi:uncharacterized protein LOC114289502 [Camellia sinensis]|uniref:uncharacterized protein LOC114289502 n=1 Tax=Camellia sinensis TaxID=4442 RepID=UPI001035BEE9|nr:uncharacterized protein LOC114289502 [Camellia sinensis]
MVDTDYKKARKFEGGLNLEVFDRVGVLKLPTHVEVFDRALMAEGILATKRQALAPTTEWKGKQSKFNFKKGRSFPKRQNTGSSSSSSQTSGSTPNCPDCGRKHKGLCHRASGACFRCDKTGHMIWDCPLRFENANRPAASSGGFAPTTRTNARTNVRGNTEIEMLRQERVFALVPKDKLTSPLEPMSCLLSASTPTGGSMICAYVYPTCDVVIEDSTLYVDLLPLSIDHFDCILAMDWLMKYCAIIDCVNKTVIFRPPGLLELVFTGNGVVPPPYLISFMKAKKLLRKGVEATYVV